MQKTLKNVHIYFFVLILMLFVCTGLLTGCQSTDKNQSYFDTSKLENVRIEYDSDSNQSNVIWTSTLTNNTIYNINSFSVTFKSYENSILVKTETYIYEIGIKHGSKISGTFNFYTENKIDNVEFLSWTANYDSVWETYKIWFIVTIVLAGIALLIYTIVMIVEDLDPSDTFEAIGDFFEDHGWVAICFVIPFAGTIWGLIASYWVPILIVLGGVIAFVLLSLIAHFIKFISEVIADNISFGDFGIRRGSFYNDSNEEEEYFDPNEENVSDYTDDGDTLMLFNVKQLKAYCRETGINGYSSLNKSELVDLILNQKNENVAPTETKQKNISLKKHKISFDDIAGLEEAKSAFREKVIYAFEHKDLYERYGKKVGGGLLLYGLPGTGKTMFAEAASNETDSLFIPIKCSDIKSKWYGESESNIKKIFEKARKASKAIIFFDEFEAIGAKRTDTSENGNNDLVPQILAEMQGIGSNDINSIIMVIAATNRPWSIDSAFLRPGRFDEKIYIPLPDFDARKKLFELKLKSVPQEKLDYDYLAKITDGFNGADIGAFCDKLKMLAINKSIANNLECPISMDEVLEVQSVIKSSVSSEDVAQLLAFKEQYR